MYKVQYSNKFKKQLKNLRARGYDMTLFETVVTMLSQGKPLPEKYSDHRLNGKWQGYRDCHIQPDWILIYRIDKGVLTLYLTETGTHADLF